MIVTHNNVKQQLVAQKSLSKLRFLKYLNYTCTCPNSNKAFLNKRSFGPEKPNATIVAVLIKHILLFLCEKIFL